MARWLRWMACVLAADVAAVGAVIAWAGVDWLVHVWRPAHR